MKNSNLTRFIFYAKNSRSSGWAIAKLKGAHVDSGDRTKAVEFCADCGSILVPKVVQIGYDRQTSKPIYITEKNCPTWWRWHSHPAD